MEYLLQNKLLSNRQYGFIKGRSTLLQLLNMLDKWTHDLESRGADSRYFSVIVPTRYYSLR